MISWLKRFNHRSLSNQISFRFIGSFEAFITGLELGFFTLHPPSWLYAMHELSQILVWSSIHRFIFFVSSSGRRIVKGYLKTLVEYTGFGFWVWSFGISVFYCCSFLFMNAATSASSASSAMIQANQGVPLSGSSGVDATRPVIASRGLASSNVVVAISSPGLFGGIDLGGWVSTSFSGSPSLGADSSKAGSFSSVIPGSSFSPGV